MLPMAALRAAFPCEQLKHLLGDGQILPISFYDFAIGELLEEQGISIKDRLLKAP